MQQLSVFFYWESCLRMGIRLREGKNIRDYSRTAGEEIAAYGGSVSHPSPHNLLGVEQD